MPRVKATRSLRSRALLLAACLAACSSEALPSGRELVAPRAPDSARQQRSSSEPTVVIQTANLGPYDATAQRYRARLKALRATPPHELSLIGLQEDDYPSCGAQACLSEVLPEVFGPGWFSSLNSQSLTALARGVRGSLYAKIFPVGADRWSMCRGLACVRDALFGTEQRWLLEQHFVVGDRILPFFVTHLSHDDQAAERVAEVERAVAIVRLEMDKLAKRAPGVVLTVPVLVGDFNFVVDHEPAPLALLQRDFELVHSDGLDHIWIGRPSRFPQASAVFEIGAKGTIPLQQGFDHPSPFVLARIRAAQR